MLQQWIDRFPDNGGSLVRFGAMIGYLERALILSFILLDEYIAVGIVPALKAAYRCKDAAEHPQEEYLLMGTFLSRTITLATKFILTLL